MPEQWRIRVPVSEADPDGPAVWGSTDAFVGERQSDGKVYDGVVLTVTIHPEEGVEENPFTEMWIRSYRFVYVGVEENPSHLKVYRRATPEEVRKLRAPEWIQGEERPECCGRPMFFVGQIEDRELCNEAPDDARLWWHDVAFFYVFTCSQCLSVKAVGQQF